MKDCEEIMRLGKNSAGCHDRRERRGGGEQRYFIILGVKAKRPNSDSNPKVVSRCEDRAAA